MHDVKQRWTLYLVEFRWTMNARCLPFSWIMVNLYPYIPCYSNASIQPTTGSGNPQSAGAATSAQWFCISIAQASSMFNDQHSNCPVLYKDYLSHQFSHHNRRPLEVEVCSGCGNLSQAMRLSGWKGKEFDVSWLRYMLWSQNQLVHIKHLYRHLRFSTVAITIFFGLLDLWQS